MNDKPPAPETCPVCGADVPRKARACPQCGADEKSGWNEEDTGVDGLDLPDEEFNYDDFVAKEFGSGPRRTLRQWAWWVVALIVVLVLLAGWLSFGH